MKHKDIHPEPCCLDSSFLGKTPAVTAATGTFTRKGDEGQGGHIENPLAFKRIRIYIRMVKVKISFILQ